MKTKPIKVDKTYREPPEQHNTQQHHQPPLPRLGRGVAPHQVGDEQRPGTNRQHGVGLEPIEAERDDQQRRVRAHGAGGRHAEHRHEDVREEAPVGELP